jgi:uncharacterized membrane protein YphA (DoxX/SURF4 family)
MEIISKTARISYGVMISGLGVQQIFYGNFRPVILPPWPLYFPGQLYTVYVASFVLILAGLFIAFNNKARTISLILGGLFLLLIVFCQVPYEIKYDQYNMYLGSWAFAFKELVFAGGAFVVAGALPVGQKDSSHKIWLLELLEKFIPLGGVFFCMTMICFGIDHFLYTKAISVLVPGWLHAAMFWTWFAGAALMASGITIILKIKLKLSALLLASMLFLWLIMLHIPRALADTYSLQGNEISSVFEAFGFSGTAFLIAYGDYTRKAI